MNDVSHAETPGRTHDGAAVENAIRRFMVAALLSARASAAFLTASSDSGIRVLARAVSVGGERHVAFLSARPDDFGLDEPMIRHVIVGRSPMRRDLGRADGELRSNVCVPVDFPDSFRGALYLEIMGERPAADIVESLEWQASALAATLTRNLYEAELHGVKEEAARIERELRLNLDMIPALTWVAGPGGELEEASRQWHEYTGIDREAALGVGFLASFHPDDVEKVVSAWTELLVTGKPGGVEARIVRHDGEARYFMLRAVPLFSDNGRIVKWYGINTDIEDLKRTQFELAKSRAALSEGQRMVQSGIWSWDAATDVFSCSLECAGLVGLSSENITSSQLVERVHPDDLGLLRNAYDKMLKGHELNVSHRIVMPDGEVRFVHGRGRLIVDENGNRREYIGTIIDVTDSKRSEQRIQQALAEAQRAEATLAEAQKLSHVGSFRIRPLTGEIIWSAETYNIYGLDSCTPLTAEAIMERIHPDDRERINEVYATGIRDRKQWEAEHRLLMPDGSIRHVHCVTRVETDPEQEPEVFGAIIDLTDRVNSEEALRKAQADIVRMNRVTAMGAVTVSIAHEMNQPLMAIVTNAATCLSWLDRPAPDLDEARVAAERIVKEGKRAGDVLLNVRNMARNSRPSIAMVDINEVVADVMTMMRSELRSRQIKAAVSLSPAAKPIRGDKIQLQQVLLNLMLNAAEATTGREQGRTISVTSADHDSRSVAVRIEDNGHGLDPIASERIFEAFFSTKPEGTGMGLAISRSIIEAHSGTLSARPLTAGGTVFEFSIPYARGAHEPEAT
ncbi:PAS domain-containing protein [Rhizobium leguminosarum]|uniref:PAS domain-containing sensor histidine kinase n=1 Tax=Rhizobium leguminosarum TaxID=384 RepID=UPI001C97E68D|nr:PAS domain-containing protein [Rhizobium leguminosarum]MBY5399490.1 PAS domain-containing protein [Rhizobium leguminosarum]